MAKAEAFIEDLVSFIERGEPGLPEVKRRYVLESMRAAGQVESRLGLLAHTKYEKPKKELNPQQTRFCKSLTGALGVPLSNDQL